MLSALRISPTAAIRTWSRSMGTIADTLVKVTFVDYKGERHTVPGRVGERLTEVAQTHGLTDILHCDASGGGAVYERANSDTWTEDLFGEGPTSALSHVVIPGMFLDKIQVRADPFALPPFPHISCCLTCPSPISCLSFSRNQLIRSSHCSVNWRSELRTLAWDARSSSQKSLMASQSGAPTPRHVISPEWGKKEGAGGGVIRNGH